MIRGHFDEMSQNLKQIYYRWWPVRGKVHIKGANGEFKLTPGRAGEIRLSVILSSIM